MNLQVDNRSVTRVLTYAKTAPSTVKKHYLLDVQKRIFMIIKQQRLMKRV